MIGLIPLRNVGSIVCICMVLTRSLNKLIRNLYFILKTESKYKLSTEFVLAQVHGNNH